MKTVHVARTLKAIGHIASYVARTQARGSAFTPGCGLFQYRGFTGGVTGGVRQAQKHKHEKQEDPRRNELEEAPRILITGNHSCLSVCLHIFM